MSAESTIRIRPMAATDLDRLVEISAGLHHAPQWPRRTYEAMIRVRNLSKAHWVHRRRQDDRSDRGLCRCSVGAS